MIKHIIGICHFALLVSNDWESQSAARDFVDVFDPSVGIEDQQAAPNRKEQKGYTYPPCDSMVLADRPINLTLRFENSGSSFANAPNSVVQTGV